MNRLLVFTENYNVPAGGASYIVDLCSGAADLYDEIVFASNPTGLAPDTSPRVVAPHRMIDNVRFITADRIGVEATAATWIPARLNVPHRLVGAARKHESRLFAYNVGVCRRLIRRTRPSAVIAYNGGYPAARAVLAMTVAARRECTPVALVVVSVPADKPEPGRTVEWETRMDAMVAESVDAIIVNAHAIGEALVTNRGLPAEKVRVIHNALADVALPEVPERSGLRIGCVSRLDHMKGTPFLVEAFARIAKRVPGAELMLVGDGPERDTIATLVRDLGLEDRVIMTGHYPGDINDLVVTFDIYAFPSLWEGLPYALLEAMRAGRAIVATDVGGVSEAIIDGETGILVPPGSDDALETAITRLIDDEGLRDRFSRSAREFYEREFSVSAMHRHAHEVLLEMGLAGPSRPAAP